MAEDNKIIFSMFRVGKTFPPHRQVLKNISLSFYLGAKIGIIRLNGSGKSTLLKIIAGQEKEFQGEVTFLPGYPSGIFHRILCLMKPGLYGKLSKKVQRILLTQSRNLKRSTIVSAIPRFSKTLIKCSSL